jgi:hypothetical protein
MQHEHVIIIGAMKAGTTSLYSYLAAHPRICPCKLKEPEFFSTMQGHGKAVSRYDSLWDFDPDKHDYKIEASTGYTKYPHEQGVPQRMWDHGLRPHLIYVVRDPIARIESQLGHMRIIHGDQDKSPLSAEYVSVSRYHTQLTQYVRVFGDELRLHIVDFDTLKTSPRQAVTRCLDFLALSNDTELGIVGERFNTTQTSLIDVLLGKLRGSEWVNRIFTGSRRRRLQKLVRGLLPAARRLSPSSGRVRVTAEEKAALREMLQDEMDAFRREYGFDVSQWGF